jgi:hypothetical protein
MVECQKRASVIKTYLALVAARKVGLLTLEAFKEDVCVDREADGVVVELAAHRLDCRVGVPSLVFEPLGRNTCE